MRGNVLAVCLSVMILSFGLLRASAHATAFTETFDTDASNTATTLATYPAFTYTGTQQDLSVVGGRLFMPAPGSNIEESLLIPGFAGDILITVDVGSDPGGGFYNVGLQVGDNRMVFHPGFVSGFGTGEGAFRVEGPGGFGNTMMGFTPPGGGVLHKMEVVITAATGQFHITVTDGTNSANVFNTAFTNPGYSPFAPIGLTVEGAQQPPGAKAVFDNLHVTPEPGTWLLLSTGLVGLLGYGWRRKHQGHA